MKTKIVQWFNRRTNEIEFGIDVKRPSDDDWMHLCEGKKALIFKTRKEARSKMKEAQEKWAAIEEDRIRKSQYKRLTNQSPLK